MSSTRSWRRRLPLAIGATGCLLAALGAGPLRPAAADDPAPATLESRVAALERRVDEMEKLLRAILAAIQAAQQEQSAAAGGAADPPGRPTGEVQDKLTGVKLPSVDLKPNVLCGHVLNSAGKPIDAAFGKVQVHAVGTAFRSGERNEYRSEVDDRGYYQMRVTEGSYFASATIQVTVGQDRLILDLRPVQTDATKVDSAAGVRRDFIWSLSGTKPGQPGNPRNPEQYYGMQFKLQRKDVPGAGPPPKNTRYVITLTPNGPLLDGSAGRPRVAQGVLSNSVDDLIIADVPIGNYLVSGKAALADGSERLPWLLVGQENGRDIWNRQLEARVKVFTFGGLSNSLETHQIELTEADLEHLAGQ
jgi:hypothetical protein